MLLNTMVLIACAGHAVTVSSSLLSAPQQAFRLLAGPRHTCKFARTSSGQENLARAQLRRAVKVAYQLCHGLVRHDAYKNNTT